MATPAPETDSCQNQAAEACAGYCPYFHRMIELIGRRWTGAVILVLLGGSHAFGAIRAEIPGLSDRLLSERLNELACAGLVERESSGRETIYSLTDKGRDLRATFEALENFTSNWADSIEPAC